MRELLGFATYEQELFYVLPCEFGIFAEVVVREVPGGF